MAVSPVNITGSRFPYSTNGQLGPFPYSGKLYAVLVSGNATASPYKMGVFVSADNGSTWTEADSANNKTIYLEGSPPTPSYDPLSDVSWGVCVHATVSSRLLILWRNPTGNYAVSEFQMDTGLWGATSPNGPTPVFPNTGDDYIPYNQFRVIGMSSTGAIHCLAALTCDLCPIPAARTWLFTLNGGSTSVASGTWAASVRMPNQTLMTTGETIPPGYYPVGIVPANFGLVHGLVRAIKDADPFSPDYPGAVHWLVDDGAGAQGVSVDIIVAQTVAAPNSTFPWLGAGSTVHPSGGTAINLIAPNTVAAPATTYRAYSAFSQAVPTFVSVSLGTIAANYTPAGCGDDITTLAIAVVDVQTPGDVVSALYTRALTPGNSVTAPTLVDTETSPDGYSYFQPASVVHTSSVSVVFLTTAFPVVGSAFSSAAILAGPPAPPAPSTVINPPPYGAKLIILCPNYFDVCLKQVTDDSKWIRDLGKPPDVPSCTPGWDEPDFVVAPYLGDEWLAQDSIPLPGSTGSDNLVLTYQIPTGYDGVIWGLLAMYTGTGFVQGSGDIVYRVQNNRRWLKGLGSLQVSLGSLVGFYPLSERERIYSGQTLRTYVQLGSGSLARLSGGRILMGLNGWLYPRRKHKGKRINIQ